MRGEQEVLELFQNRYFKVNQIWLKNKRGNALYLESQ